MDAATEKFPESNPYVIGMNNPLTYKDPNGMDPEPTQNLVVQWFCPRIDLIRTSSKKYGISPKFLAAILFRENQNLMSKDKLWTKAWLTKETLAMVKAYSFGENSEMFETWSSGIAQMQVKLVVRLEQDLSVDEYKIFKSILSETKEGQEEFQKILGKAGESFSNEKNSIDLLAKYISQLLKENPDSTPEKIIEDYARGPHLSRSIETPMPQNLKKDIKIYQKFKEFINDLLNEE